MIANVDVPKASPQDFLLNLLFLTVPRKLHRPMAAPTGYMPNLQAPGQ
jgi:hypothetical protein